MNFFPVELRGDAAVFSHDGHRAPLDAGNAARKVAQAASGKGVLGVRPEHFAVVCRTSRRHSRSGQTG